MPEARSYFHDLFADVPPRWYLDRGEGKRIKRASEEGKERERGTLGVKWFESFDQS